MMIAKSMNTMTLIMFGDLRLHTGGIGSLNPWQETMDDGLYLNYLFMN